MCNRYTSPEQREIEEFWQIGAGRPLSWPKSIFPRAPGPFIRRARDDAGFSRELVVGQWGLIPWVSKTAKLTYSTNNARSEELESKASYKDPWKRGQRCIIPASSFDEPNWESGKNQWWIENNEIHSAQVTGPFIGDRQFAVKFDYDTTVKPTGQRAAMTEMALYDVADGRIGQAAITRAFAPHAGSARPRSGSAPPRFPAAAAAPAWASAPGQWPRRRRGRCGCAGGPRCLPARSTPAR